ncbi:RepB family protein [Chitinibacter sp. S2-10]|uniref:RepB family protein n=1 Tax=Chitinibacter sp. S2-10 TaxID=3373597 RepID=UPI00397748AB
MTDIKKRPRGRPALSGKAMSVAERKRRSRALQVMRATQDHNQRLPKALSVEIDASLHQRFRKYCEANGLTQAQGLEHLLSQLPV